MKCFGYTREDEFGNTYYTDEAASFGEKIFKTMRAVADEFISETGADYMINTEQIPGESAAAKLMKKDKFFYPNTNVYDLPLYHNGGVDRSGEGFQGRELGACHAIIGLPIAKVALEDGNHLGWVHVTRHTDGHIVGAIVVVEIVLDVGD